MSLDLKPAIITALMADATTIAYLDDWQTGKAIATRSPVPSDFPARCIIVRSPAAVGNEDAINSSRPILVQDIAIYGNQPDDYREVEVLGFHIRELFHRNKWVIEPTGFQVVDIVVSGPIPGPVDDDQTVARIVTLNIRLRKSQ